MDPNSSLNEVVGGFCPISLSEMDNVKLMNRVDSKFIFNINKLPVVLAELCNDYSILTIDAKSVFQYESLYFDTPSFDLYKYHHCGRPNRVKVRYRKYVDSGLVFFEIKKKIKEGRTDKYRIKRDEINQTLDTKDTALLDQLAVSFKSLEKKVWVNYKRITLVSKNTHERITIDFDMMFDNMIDKKNLPYLVIAEVKQERFSRMSSFISVLRKYRIPSSSISKYALSVVMMRNDVKKNVFKGLVNKVNKTQYNS